MVIYGRYDSLSFTSMQVYLRGGRGLASKFQTFRAKMREGLDNYLM